MRTVSFEEFGGPEVLRIVEKPDPTPEAGEVVVRVAATTVNPTDLMNLNGTRAALMKHLPKPYTSGSDFAGRIEATGRGVSGLSVGQPVLGVVSPRRPQGGAHAELIAVPQASVAALSDETDLVAAATVPMNTLTALLSLELLRLQPGQTLLVTGGAGMLGSVSIELALLEGLHVLANVSERDAAFVGGLGDVELLPRGNDLPDAIKKSCPRGLDGIIDGALISRELAPLVRDGGGIVSPRATYQVEDPRLNVSYVQVTSGVEDHEKIQRIADLLRERRITTRVAENGVFPFTRAADAYRMAERGGFRGRVVLTFA